MVMSKGQEIKAKRADPHFVTTNPIFRQLAQDLSLWTRVAMEIISYAQRMKYSAHRARFRRLMAESPPGETDRDFVMRAYKVMYEANASHMTNNIQRWICEHAGAPYLRAYARKKQVPKTDKGPQVDAQLEIELDARSSQSKDINPDSIL